jgi:hypothetical protein
MDLPQSYQDWKHCIIHKCKIELTAPYVAERIRALSQNDSEETKKFRALYGERHLSSVLGWFKQAASELS